MIDGYLNFKLVTFIFVFIPLLPLDAVSLTPSIHSQGSVVFGITSSNWTFNPYVVCLLVLVIFIMQIRKCSCLKLTME